MERFIGGRLGLRGHGRNSGRNNAEDGDRRRGDGKGARKAESTSAAYPCNALSRSELYANETNSGGLFRRGSCRLEAAFAARADFVAGTSP